MPKSLSELNLKEEVLPTAGQPLDDLPVFGQFTPPPQPGAFRFKLPADLNNIWDLYTVDGKGDRISAVFDQNNPLLIVQSPGGKHNTEPFQTRLNNNERPRGKGGSGGTHSDLDYLLAAFDPKQPKPKSNREYIERVKVQGGKEFGADIRLSWRCGEQRNIRVRDQSGAVVEVENKKGCGTGYYQEDVKKNEAGEFPLEIQCGKCGALLRAFANIDNLRA